MAISEDLARANELYHCSQLSLSSAHRALDAANKIIKFHEGRNRNIISKFDTSVSKKNNELSVALIKLEETKEKLLDSKRSVELLSAWKSKALKKLKRQGR